MNDLTPWKAYLARLRDPDGWDREHEPLWLDAGDMEPDDVPWPEIFENARRLVAAGLVRLGRRAARPGIGGGKRVTPEDRRCHALCPNRGDNDGYVPGKHRCTRPVVAGTGYCVTHTRLLSPARVSA